MRWLLAPILISVGMIVPTQAISQMITVEAEWYTDWLDLGGGAIGEVVCHYASNDTAVEGFDVEREWICLDVTFPEQGYWANSLRCAGLAGLTSIVRLTLSSDHPLRATQTSDVETVGSGIG